MNTRTTRFALSRSTVPTRAQFSPVYRRAAHAAHPRGSSAERTVPSSDSLTPDTPTLAERFWDPHLIDRLEMPLSRIRE